MRDLKGLQGKEGECRSRRINLSRWNRLRKRDPEDLQSTSELKKIAKGWTSSVSSKREGEKIAGFGRKRKKRRIGVCQLRLEDKIGGERWLWGRLSSPIVLRGRRRTPSNSKEARQHENEKNGLWEESADTHPHTKRPGHRKVQRRESS